MSTSENSFSNYDSSYDSGSRILDNAMIKSTESSNSSDFSDIYLNNNCAISVTKCNETTDSDSTITSSNSPNSSLSSRQSIILAGSHKQNSCSFIYEKKKTLPSYITLKVESNPHKLHTFPEHVSDNKTPRIVVTPPTPQKSSPTLNITNRRNIVSPVAQYMKGKGTVKGRKIVIK